MEVSGHGRLLVDGDLAEVQQQQGDRSRPFYPKRSHKKSRKGCINCKTRKVKCDEGLPSCRSCLLRHDLCVYRPSSSAASRAQTRRPLTFVQTTFRSGKPTSSSSSSVTSKTGGETGTTALTKASPPSTTPLRSSSPFGILPPSQKYDAVDMKLLWNYTMKTLYSFLADEDYQQLAAGIFRNDVVAMAFDAPFLMDSILAVSCLELHRSDPTFSLERSFRYHVRAIEGYNRAIQEARRETLPAILVNAVFVALLTTHTFRDPDAKDLYIVDWLCVWRGTGAIVDLVGLEVILESGLGIALYRPSVDIEASARFVPDDLALMVSSIPPDDEDYLSLPAFTTVLDLLGSLYLHLRHGFGADLDQRVTCWFTYMPRGFAILGQQLRPRALVIIAHYVCFLKLVKKVWWIEGIADRSIRDIYNHLGPEWRPSLLVPLAILPLTDRTAIARILLGDPDWVCPQRSKAEIGEDFVYLSEEDQLAAAGLHLQKEQDKDNEQDLLVDMEISRQMSDTHL